MTIFVNGIALVFIVVTICFVISIGAPFYIVILVGLGLCGPLLCSLEAIDKELK